MMDRCLRVLAGLLLALASVPAAAEPQPSALVTTAAARRGTLPELVAGYGMARPALDAATTISQQIDGQVVSIAVTPGEAVRSGQPLLEFRPAPAAISLYRQAVTALDAARVARGRTAQLLAGHLATRDQLAQADKAVADAATALDALRREGGGGGQTVVTAPFDGTVDTVPVAQGTRVAPGMPLLTLIARNGLVVTVGIDAAELGGVRVGAPAALTRLSGGAALAGHVLRVDSTLNPRTRMVDVDLSVPVGAVLSGEAFEARIPVRQVTGWLVPHEAMLSDEHGAWVFQVVSGHAVRVPVEVGIVAGDTDLVTGGIDPARALVVDGAWQLDDGMAVRTGTTP